MSFNTILKQGSVSVIQADLLMTFEQVKELLTKYQKVSVDENGYIRATRGLSVDIIVPFNDIENLKEAK